MIDIATATADDFEQLADRTFAVVDDAGSLVVTLALTEVRRGRPVPTGREPFALTFVGPAEPLLEQRLQPLRHADHGDLEVFMTPVARDAGSATYEAVFG